MKPSQQDKEWSSKTWWNPYRNRYIKFHVHKNYPAQPAETAGTKNKDTANKDDITQATFHPTCNKDTGKNLCKPLNYYYYNMLKKLQDNQQLKTEKMKAKKIRKGKSPIAQPQTKPKNKTCLQTQQPRYVSTDEDLQDFKTPKNPKIV